MSQGDQPPMLDAHAHIAPDVTPTQLRALGNARVVAVTRTIAEGRYAANRRDPNLIWGLGTHPATPEALTEYDEHAFRQAITGFALVGEVGLDRRGDKALQADVFASILRIAADQPVLISIHSTGRTSDVLDALTANPHPGAVLHWFNGTPAQIERAITLGCYFSVNAAMAPETIAAIPPDRLLTETDFPASRTKTQAKKPGDVTAAETLVSTIHDTNARDLVADNFKRLLDTTGARQRLTTPWN